MIKADYIQTITYNLNEVRKIVYGEPINITVLWEDCRILIIGKQSS